MEKKIKKVETKMSYPVGSITILGQVGSGRNSYDQTTAASNMVVVDTIQRNIASEKLIKQNIDPNSGGISASVTHISNSLANLARTIICDGSRIFAEHLYTTGLMLNGSICQGFIAICRENLNPGVPLVLPTAGCSDLHQIPSSSDRFHALLKTAHDMQLASMKGLSDPKNYFGENVSSAHLWLAIPETAGLLLVAVCEALYHGVESGIIASGAIAEFEPFCEAACNIISGLSKEGQTRYQQCHDQMLAMIKDQSDSNKEALLRDPSIKTSQGNPKTRQSTHATYATTLFSIPLSISKFKEMLKSTESIEGSTLATKRSTVLYQEAAEKEKQPNQQDWPEKGPLGQVFSLCNTMRQLVVELGKENMNLPNEQKQSMAQSGFQTSNTFACLSVLLGEMALMRSLLARSTEAPKTINDTKAYSDLIKDGIDSKQTLSVGECKKGSCDIERTENNSKQKLEEAANYTKHERRKPDLGLVSAGSELPALGNTGTTISRSMLTTATVAQTTNNAVTVTSHESWQKTISMPLKLTTEPFNEMVKIVKEVSQQQERPQYSTLSNDISILSAQFEEIQRILTNRPKDKGVINSTYSTLSAALMEPTVLATLSVKTLSQVFVHFDCIKKALNDCCNALRDETQFQTVETKARTNINGSQTSNPAETVSQSLANTLEVSQQQLRNTNSELLKEELMAHELTLSAIEKAVSLASLEISKVLSLLTANSGNTLHYTGHIKHTANLSFFDGEKSAEESSVKTLKDPEKEFCKNDCSTGLGASTNITSLLNTGSALTFLKILETVHILGSLASESLLQALIFATHPIDQTFAAIQAWHDQVWIQESHIIQGESKSVSTDQQNQITTATAKMARNLVFSLCIFSGCSENDQLALIPAPKALQAILDTFGNERSNSETKDTSKILSEMRELTLKREEIMYDELKSMLATIHGRRTINAGEISTMGKTQAWITNLKNNEILAVTRFPDFEHHLKIYVHHILTSANSRRWSSTGAGRNLTDRELSIICDELVKQSFTSS